MNDQPTITNPTFDGLPTWEKALIRSVVRALNDARSSSEVTTIALADKSLRVPEPPQWLIQLKASKRREDRNAAENARIRALAEQHIDGLMIQGLDQLRAQLPEFVRSGRLADACADGLLTLYQDEVIDQTAVAVVDGHARFSRLVQFRSGYGAVAYALLRLSQLNSAEPVLLICAECEKLKLIESTGGDKISRFCSGPCRNRFNVREHRAKKAAEARKHK